MIAKYHIGSIFINFGSPPLVKIAAGRGESYNEPRYGHDRFDVSRTNSYISFPYQRTFIVVGRTPATYLHALAAQGALL